MSGTFGPCCTGGECCGPGSYCCANTGPHTHPEEQSMSNPTICPQCHGAGSITTDDGLGPDHHTCPACEGTGDTAGPVEFITPAYCLCSITGAYGPAGYQISYTAHPDCPTHAEAIRAIADQGGPLNLSIDKDPQP